MASMMDNTRTPESSTYVKPKAYYDEGGVFTVEFTDSGERSWTYFTQWTCIPTSGECEIILTRRINEHLFNMMRHFDRPPSVKLASLRNPEQKVILVFGHDTEANAFNMFHKFTDVRNTVLSFLRNIKILAEDIKVRVRLIGTSQSAWQQDQGHNCMFDPTPDYPEEEKSETTWFCIPDIPNLVVDNETGNSQFTRFKENIRHLFRARLRRVSTGSVIFTFHHESTENALEMISKHEEVRAMILECLQGIDSTVKDIQMEVQLQDFIATPTPARRDTRADADLRDACREGNLTKVKRILDTGRADVNCRNVFGTTPVMAAAGRGHRDVVEFLVSQGADVTLVTNDGDNILHLACRGGDRKIVKFVLSLGRVDVNSRGWRSRPPVMAAAWWGHRRVVELLVSRGADVSLVTDDGNNILHCACIGGDRNTVEFVLSLDGVDVNARNNYGQTAADMARDEGHHQLLDLLVSRGTQ